MSADYEDLIDLGKLAGALGIPTDELAELTEADHDPWLGSEELGDGQLLRAEPGIDGGLVMEREQAIEFVHRVLDWQLERAQISEQAHEQRLTDTLVALSTGL